jgi:hypothetical protein
LDYYKEFTKLKIIETGEWSQFIKAGRITEKFYSVIAEKIDIEPSQEFLARYGISHGMVFWMPMRRIEKPKWWLQMPRYFAKNSVHSSRSAFSILDREDYWMKWSPKARAHRRKILEYIKSWKLRIDRISDWYAYLDIYKNMKVPDPFQDFIIKWCEKKFTQWLDNLRIYIAYIDDKPLAGGIFIDDGVTSEYFTSFYHEDSKPYHLGIAMMDRWMFDSYEKWVKYCDLDHMRDNWQSLGYAGYTKFKSSIADYDVYFHDMWVKIF